MKKIIRFFSLFFLLTLLNACGTYRSIPPEILALHEIKPPKVPTRNPSPIVVKGEIVILDAGHGGKDTGAASVKDDYEEKTLTLSTTLLVKNYLKQLGYNTVLTRTQDTFVPLEKRAEVANSLNADLFVSIHYNFCPNPEAEGIEVFYYKETTTPTSSRILESKKLGKGVLNHIVEKTGAHPRGVKQANFAVIRETNMPAILIEAGFLSNPTERKNIKDAKYTRSLARGIAKGIDEYLESKRKL